MLILPDRHQPRGKFLMPLRRREWSELGQTYWRVSARCHDGYVRWRGWFEDREDADAFMWGVFTGEIVHDRDLWRQPTPNWYPGIGEDLLYAVDNVTIKTTPTNTQTLWTSPVDWDNLNNKIEVLAGGGGGGCREGASGPLAACGGGGGAYSQYLNFAVATPGVSTAYWTVGAGTSNKTSSGDGSSGYDSWFNGTAVIGSTCGAKAGQGGDGNASSSANGGAGGSSASGTGSTKYSGGRGGDISGVSAVGGTGGGGAAGPHGVGRQGDDGNGNDRTDGGNGDLDYGGAGGAGSGADGGNGTEWDASHGSGGGGASDKGGSGTMVAGDGGYYGAGGGGSAVGSNGSATGGAGRQGLIVITYTPLIPVFAVPTSSFFV